MLEGDVIFLNTLIVRGGATSILASGPSKEVQALAGQGLCTVSSDLDSNRKVVAITEQGRIALKIILARREIKDAGRLMTVADICRMQDLSVHATEEALASMQRKGLITGFVPGNLNAEIRLMVETN